MGSLGKIGSACPHAVTQPSVTPSRWSAKTTAPILITLLLKIALIDASGTARSSPSPTRTGTTTIAWTIVHWPTSTCWTATLSAPACALLVSTWRTRPKDASPAVTPASLRILPGFAWPSASGTLKPSHSPPIGCVCTAAKHWGCMLTTAPTSAWPSTTAHGSTTLTLIPFQGIVFAFAPRACTPRIQPTRAPATATLGTRTILQGHAPQPAPRPSRPTGTQPLTDALRFAPRVIMPGMTHRFA